MYKLIFLGLALAGIALMFNACARKSISNPERTLDEIVIVDRLKNDSYRLTFNREGTWKIFKGKNAKSIDWSEPIAVTEGTEIILGAMEKKRVFFGVLTPKNKPIIVTERRIYLEGASNFRDIGGLATKDGRVVSWGKIYRSNKLSDLSGRDVQYLANLGLKAVCDFRYDVEIEKDPNRLPAGVTYYKFPIGGKEGVEYHRIKRQVIKGDIRRAKAKDKFVEIMQLFADSGAHDFKPVMDMLVEGKEVPLVFHCSGGKDRTGFMASIILAALNVDEKTIKEEYLMSNFYRYRTNKSGVRKARLIGIDHETLTYAFVVQKEYIDGVFDIIKERYGDMDNYLEQKFGLTPELRQRMIDIYTYPALNAQDITALVGISEPAVEE